MAKAVVNNIVCMDRNSEEKHESEKIMDMQQDDRKSENFNLHVENTERDIITPDFSDRSKSEKECEVPVNLGVEKRIEEANIVVCKIIEPYSEEKSQEKENKREFLRALGLIARLESLNKINKFNNIQPKKMIKPYAFRNRKVMYPIDEIYDYDYENFKIRTLKKTRKYRKRKSKKNCEPLIKRTYRKKETKNKNDEPVKFIFSSNFNTYLTYLKSKMVDQQKHCENNSCDTDDLSHPQIDNITPVLCPILSDQSAEILRNEESEDNKEGDTFFFVSIDDDDDSVMEQNQIDTNQIHQTQVDFSEIQHNRVDSS